ncbi:hypothetical protein K3495_g5770 [Podosphaera aphanis]|nr:hypothetical protein K3495_g5770 [Podosphaera aphanis]
MMRSPTGEVPNRDGNKKWHNINQRRKSKHKRTSSVDFVHTRAGSPGPATTISNRASALRRSPIGPSYPNLRDDLPLSPSPPPQQTSNDDIANLLRTIQLQLSEQSRRIAMQDELIADLSTTKTSSSRAKGKQTAHCSSSSKLPGSEPHFQIKKSIEEEDEPTYTIPARRKSKFPKDIHSQSSSDVPGFSHNELPKRNFFRERNSQSKTPLTSRIHRVPDLSEKLDDGINPTFDAWEIMLQGNLDSYACYLTNPIARKTYVFSQTRGTAQSHLTQRMKSDHPQRFQDDQEMLSWLSGFFRDPNERETARVAYSKCRMSVSENFNQFYSRFSELSSKARIAPEDTLSDLFHKLSPELHKIAIPFMATSPTLPIALQRFMYFDNELRLNRETVANQTRRATPNPLPSVRFSLPKSSSSNYSARDRGLLLTPSSSPALTSQQTTRSPSVNINTEVIKCYNCQKIGHYSTDCTQPRRSQSRAPSHIQEIGLDQTTLEDGDRSDSENDEP